MWAASGRVSALRSLKCWCADSLISSIGVVKKSYPSYPPLKNSISASRLRVPKTSSAPFPLRTLAYIAPVLCGFRLCMRRNEHDERGRLLPPFFVYLGDRFHRYHKANSNSYCFGLHGQTIHQDNMGGGLIMFRIIRTSSAP